MKRYLLALCAVLGLAFIGLSPSTAQAAVTCTKLTNGGVYPEGYLWWCATANATPEADAVSGLANLGNSGGSANNAKTTLSTNNHYIYVFNDQADLTSSYCTPTGNNTSSPPVPACPVAGSIPSAANGYTWRTGTAPNFTYYSAAFMDQITLHATQFGTHVGNTVAHEAGHQLDAFYGPSLYASGAASQFTRDMAAHLTGEKFTVGGTVVAGNVVTLTFDTALGGVVNVVYTVQTGDLTSDIARKLVNGDPHSTPANVGVNNNTTLSVSAINIKGTVSGSAIFITSSVSAKYGSSVAHSGGSFVTVANQDYDFSKFINATSPQCKSSGSIFGSQADANGKQICSGATSLTLGGTPHTGDMLTITVTDPNIEGGNVSAHVEKVEYTVLSTDSQGSIVTALIAAVTGDDILKNDAEVTAVSAGGTQITLSSGWTTTTYSETTTGTDTLALGTTQAGQGNTLSGLYSSVYEQRNDAVIEAAWPVFFQPQLSGSTAPPWCTVNCYSELFAETTAEVARPITSNNDNPDNYFVNYFKCTALVITLIEKNGTIPTPTQLSPGCN